MSTSRATKTELKRIDLYSSENPVASHLDGVREYLSSLFPTVEVEIRPCLLRATKSKIVDTLAGRLASARMRNPASRVQDFVPMYGEVEYEKRTIRGSATVGGVVYDASKVAAAAGSLLKSHDSLETASLVFTDRLVSTYSDDDMRHHLRTVVCGFPGVLSISGIYEAPARPREYYFAKRQLKAESAGDLALAELEQAFRDEFIDYGDPRAAEALKGLSLQAVMFHLSLEPFCGDSRCRLFNAHWQKDLIASQIVSGRLCDKHEEIVKKLSKKPVLSW